MQLIHSNAKPTMTSREIAELTGKEHRHVVRDIDTMFIQLKMDSTGYVQNWTHPQNQQEYRGYALPEDLTLNLVTGYNPELRLKIIRRWKELEVVADPLAGLPAEQRALIGVMLDNAAIKAEQAAQAALIATQADSIKRLESKQSAYENGASYFTVIGFGVHRGISFGLTDAGTLGRAAAKLSKEKGIAVDKVRDPRFGSVNSYHESMLDAALAKIHGGM